MRNKFQALFASLEDDEDTKPTPDADEPEDTEEGVPEPTDEPEAEPEGADDENGDAKIEIDIHVKDEDDISESFDHVEKADEEIDEADHTVDALKEAGEELEEAQDTLESFRKAPRQFTPLARKLLDQKLRHVGVRLGCDYSVISTEGHTGDKYDDPVFVASLESAIGDTFRKAVEAIKALLAKAVNAFKQMWAYATDVTVRIHRRMKAVKERLKDVKLGSEDITTLTKTVIKSTKVEAWAVEEGGSLTIKPDHVGALNKLMMNFGSLRTKDRAASSKLIKDIQTNLELRNAIGNSEKTNAGVIETMAKDYFDARTNDTALPGGYKLTWAKAGRKRVVAEKGDNLELMSDGALQTALEAFVGNGDNLQKFADFVERITSPSGNLTKDFDKSVRDYYKNLKSMSDKLTKEYRISDDEGGNKLLKRHPAIIQLQAAVNLGYTASLAARKVWIKAAHAASNALIVYASKKAVKAETAATAA